MYYEGGLNFAKDYVKAVEWYTIIASTDTAASLRLADMYYTGGYGLTPNYVKVVEYYDTKENESNVNVQRILGRIFHEGGYGISVDIARSIRHYKISADLGDYESQMALGKIFYERDDFEQARNYFLLLSGDRQAQYYLGLIYFRGGQWIKQDLRQAYIWMTRSKNQGYYNAQEFLRQNAKYFESFQVGFDGI
jgi:TPR repeat protein